MSPPRRRYAGVLLIVCCFAFVVGLIAGRDGVSAAGTNTGSGFTMTVTETPAGQVAPGDAIKYEFDLTNGPEVTNSAWVAIDTVPNGTALVPQSQSCGTGGGTCSQTASGSTMQWEIPAGTQPSAFFSMSFAVTVSAANPPPEILDTLTFSGPGCPPQATCAWQAPAVAVASAGGPPSMPIKAQSFGATGDVGGPTTTVTTAPPVAPQNIDDSQNLVVQVPDCDKRGKKVRCKEPPVGNGSGAQAGNPSAPDGQASTRALAATGDDQVRTVKVALASILAGSSLVLVASASRRRRDQRLR